jgi:ABC-type transport system involved in cytochrome bd biosynthesis fused ATPase/permease subunit
MDMTKMRKKAWREKVLYVSQKWGLFQGTILDNILLGSGVSHISAHSMQSFVNAYKLNDVIPCVGARVGNSASTGGGSMSGGMGKVIVILRACLRVMPESMFRKHFGSKPRRTMSRPCVVLFDEPLAALDKGSRLHAKDLIADVTTATDNSLISFVIMHSDDMDDIATLVLDWTPPDNDDQGTTPSKVKSLP